MADELKVTGDVIAVSPATHGPDGSKIEPEEAPAVHSMKLEIPLTLGGEAFSTLPGAYNTETTAGEIAASMRRRCGTCKHFNVPRWRKLRRELTWGTMEERQFVNECRATIEQCLPVEERDKHVDADGDLDLEHALDSFGLCEAATEIRSREEGARFPVISLPTGRCPDMKTLHGTDLSNLYQARDRGAERAASVASDMILNMARGRRPQ